MSKTPEAKVRDPVIKYAERLGIVHIRLYFGPGMHTGWPDDIFLLPGGRPLFIEFKRAGRPPTKKQMYRIKQLRELGYRVLWTDDSAIAKHALDEYLIDDQYQATLGMRAGQIFKRYLERDKNAD